MWQGIKIYFTWKGCLATKILTSTFPYPVSTTKDTHDTSVAMTQKNINVLLTINATPYNVPPTIINATPDTLTSTLPTPQPPPAPPSKQTHTHQPPESFQSKNNTSLNSLHSVPSTLLVHSHQCKQHQLTSTLNPMISLMQQTPHFFSIPLETRDQGEP